MNETNKKIIIMTKYEEIESKIKETNRELLKLIQQKREAYDLTSEKLPDWIHDVVGKTIKYNVISDTVEDVYYISVDEIVFNSGSLKPEEVDQYIEDLLKGQIITNVPVKIFGKNIIIHKTDECVVSITQSNFLGNGSKDEPALYCDLSRYSLNFVEDPKEEIDEFYNQLYKKYEEEN